ncbi:MAG: hypothetical protein RI922_104 [Bacteroidota bacterium]|jgi:hypothetical protein
MKMYLLLASICIALLQSCGTSSNVTSNFSIQKRKYNKGWNVKELFQHKLKSNVSEAKTIEKQSINATKVEENSTETTALSVPVSIPSSSNEINADKEIDGESNILIDQKESTLEETIQIKQNEIENPIEKDEDPTSGKISPEMKKFNTFHIVLLSMFLISLLSIILAILFESILYIVPFLVLSFPMYGFSIAQAFKIPSRVPIKEQDKQFKDKKSFALILFGLGTFILAATLCLLVIGILFL